MKMECQTLCVQQGPSSKFCSTLSIIVLLFFSGLSEVGVKRMKLKLKRLRRFNFSSFEFLINNKNWEIQIN